MSATPPLGSYDIEPLRRCTRLIGYHADGLESLCDKPAVLHVDWGEHAGFVCHEHLGEIGTRWKTHDQHGLGPYCGMPGAMWFTYTDGSSNCAYEGDVPTAPERAVAAASSTEGRPDA